MDEPMTIPTVQLASRSDHRESRPYPSRSRTAQNEIPPRAGTEPNMTKTWSLVQNARPLVLGMHSLTYLSLHMLLSGGARGRSTYQWTFEGVLPAIDLWRNTM